MIPLDCHITNLPARIQILLPHHPYLHGPHAGWVIFSGWQTHPYSRWFLRERNVPAENSSATSSRGRTRPSLLVTPRTQAARIPRRCISPSPLRYLVSVGGTGCVSLCHLCKKWRTCQFKAVGRMNLTRNGQLSPTEQIHELQIWCNNVATDK